MTRLSLLAVGGLTSTLVSGAHLADRAVCNRDDCFRQVAALKATPGPAKASADCSAFMTVRVTPCALISTFVDTPSTVTEISSVTVVSVSVSATTTTEVFTETVTTYYTATSTQWPVYKKRGGPLAENKEEKRTVPGCVAASSSAAIPAYASSCSAAGRYFSACSCNGITASTTILTPVTSYVTSVPTVTATITLTSTIQSISASISVESTTVTVTTGVAIATSVVQVSTCTAGSYTFKKAHCTDGSTCYENSSQVHCFQGVNNYRDCSDNCFNAPSCISPEYFRSSGVCLWHDGCCPPGTKVDYFIGF